MTSIRGFLTTSLLAIIVLTIFISVLNGYQYSSQEIQKQMDAELVDLAKLLSIHESTKTPSSEDIQMGNKIAYQIIHVKNKNSFVSEVKDKELIFPLEQIFNEVNFKGYRWRTYGFFNAQKNVWVVVAERIDVRLNLAEKVIIKSLYPIILVIPLVALLIWFLIGYALKPLSKLSIALKNKHNNDLSTLEIKQPYQEVEQVIQSTNQLLKRLGLSFEREKHFASDVAHELRTPLSVLKVDLFNLTRQMGGDNEGICTLNRGVDRMEHLVQQILTLYRTTPEQFMTTFKVFDLHALSQKVIAEKYDRFEQKSQTIELQGTSCLLEGDPSALEVLLMNLVENANKYTPEGGKIRVGLFEEKNSIILQVEDSGPGIDKSQYERIFDRFYRVDGDQHSSNEQGCGLGLSIVKHIVELHNAVITLEPSHFKAGLLVRVKFPKGKTDV
jgi:two-component system sensor histidine kinase QseC